MNRSNAHNYRPLHDAASLDVACPGASASGPEAPDCGWEEFSGPDFLFPFSPSDEWVDNEKSSTFKERHFFGEAIDPDEQVEIGALIIPQTMSGGDEGECPTTPSTTCTAFSPESRCSSSSLPAGLAMSERPADESKGSKSLPAGMAMLERPADKVTVCKSSTVQYLPVGMMMQGWFACADRHAFASIQDSV